MCAASCTAMESVSGQLQSLDEDMLLHIARSLSGCDAYRLCLTAKFPFFAKYFNTKGVREAFATKLLMRSMETGTENPEMLNSTIC